MMNPLITAHVILLSMWLGLVLVETILEVAGPRLSSHVAIARLHYWIDLCLELPLVLGVLITGVILWSGMGALTPAYRIKIAAALIAIASNFYCIALVVLRHRHREDDALVAVYHRRILWCWTGFPFGMTALGIGISHLVN